MPGQRQVYGAGPEERFGWASGRRPGNPLIFLGNARSEGPHENERRYSALSGAQPFTAFKEAIDKLLNPPKEEEKDKERGSQ